MVTSIMVSGSIGAIVSVMSRMTSRTLDVDHTVGRFHLRLLGTFRPVVGAVLGLALYVLVAGGLLPIEEPEGSPHLLFYSGLAFLAGFSERFAQDMVSGAGKRIAPGTAPPTAADSGDTSRARPGPTTP